MNFYLLTAYFFLVLINSSFQNHLLARARNSHFPKELNNNRLEFLATKLSNISHIERALDSLLIPRVVGTPGHKKVSQYIVKELEDLGWNIELDEFDDETPFGKLTFRNIIATLNPKADRFLTLACHYDSKYFKNHDFIGATDSGVPCAMMLNLAFVLKAELDKIKSNADLSLKLVFFDGEEAFKQWGPKDSIYGARHLAEKWHGNSRLTSFNEMATDISRIDVLVLLDLIGARNPKFYSFFQQTQKWYDRLPDAESRLADLNLLDSYNPKQIYFNKQATYSFIEDDHIPFLQRRVPVLHLIPIPFPEVWHTEGDNRDIVDISTVENINKVLRIFVAEYLHLSSSDEEDRKTSKLEL